MKNTLRKLLGMLLAAAIERYLPGAKPDFVRCRRLEMLDEQGEVFR